MTTPDTAPAPTDIPPAAPVPAALLQGTFALYLTPTQDIVVAYRSDTDGQDKQLIIPSFILAMATQASGKSPLDIIGFLQGATDE